ncbi:MAG: hypothetical protein ACI9JZ_000941 [Lentimonas sp.]|jgi:hypothetical protein
MGIGAVAHYIHLNPFRAGLVEGNLPLMLLYFSRPALTRHPVGRALDPSYNVYVSF